jgi:hypothetical protein
MNQFERHYSFYNKSVRLTEKEQLIPLEVIREFFQSSHLYEIRSSLWDLVETGLIAKNSRFSNSKERRHLLWFYEQLEIMIESAFLLCQNEPYTEDVSPGSLERTGISTPKWKSKQILQEEIRELELLTSKQEFELVQLRHFKQTGKELL